MREIEFRAKGLKGEWVFGFYSPTIWYPSFEQTPRIKTFTGSEIEIDVNTLGQYTGLKDKNGKKIYEGDIVRQQTFGKLNSKYKNEKDKNAHKEYLIKERKCIFDDEENYHHNYDYLVEYRDARFYPFADDNFEWGEYCWDDPAEVIGNIYDNSDLLKGSNYGRKRKI